MTEETDTDQIPLHADVRRRKDRPWGKYPIGTKAHAYNGGHWIRVARGWKWHCGEVFPTPGGDAIGKCIELPPPDPYRATRQIERMLPRAEVQGYGFP